MDIVSMRKQKGFSLLELMIAVSVLAILTAIALPNYQEYVRRSNQSAAQQFMLDVANRQQQFLLDTRGFAANVAALGMVAPARVSDFYTVTTAAGGGAPPTFTVTATPVAGSMQASEQAMTVNELGVKTPASEWEM